jgi:hypothetical protein
VLYRFTDAITQPDFDSHLLQDGSGNLYGANGIGRANFSGFVFKVTLSGEFNILASVPCTAQSQYGYQPQGITMDSAGNFYGSMFIGGIKNTNCPYGCGTVFKTTF